MNIPPSDLVRIIRQSSFRRPVLSLPEDKRNAMLTLYAFFRTLDDAVDNAPDRSTAEKAIHFWQTQIDAIYAGRPPSNPIAVSLAQAIRAFSLPQQYFQEMLEGQAMEASGLMFLPEPETLDRFCYCVASSVGLLTIRILGYTHEDTQHYASALGKALQYINMFRDVEKDLEHGRLYVPADLLGADTDNALDKARYSPEYKEKIREFFREKAENHLREAEEWLPEPDIAAMQPANDMATIYKQYLTAA